MVLSGFQRFPYERIGLPPRVRKLLPYIESLYSTQGRTSRNALNQFIVDLDDPILGGRKIDTNVAAKLAHYFNAQVTLRERSRTDPFYMVKNYRDLPINIVKQKALYRYTIKAKYLGKDGEAKIEHFTMTEDIPFDDIGFEALETAMLDEGGRKGHYAVRMAGSIPSFEAVYGSQQNPTL